MDKIKIAKQLVKLAKELILQNSLTDNKILYELQKVKINEYETFRCVNENQWVSQPINKIVHLPHIYVNLVGDKLTCGYHYLDKQGEDYQGVPQESIVGLLIELSVLKEKIHYIVINLKNEELDKKIEESKDNEEEESGGDDENLSEDEDLDLDLGLDEDSGGDEELDLGLDEETPSEDTSTDEQS